MKQLSTDDCFLKRFYSIDNFSNLEFDSRKVTKLSPCIANLGWKIEAISEECQSLSSVGAVEICISWRNYERFTCSRTLKLFSSNFSTSSLENLLIDIMILSRQSYDLSDISFFIVDFIELSSNSYFNSSKLIIKSPILFLRRTPTIPLEFQQSPPGATAPLNITASIRNCGGNHFLKFPWPSTSHLILYSRTN